MCMQNEQEGVSKNVGGIDRLLWLSKSKEDSAIKWRKTSRTFSSFSNFTCMFSNNISCNNSHWKYEKGEGACEIHGNHIICTAIDNVKD